MFPTRYFNQRFFAARYFPRGGGITPIITGFWCALTGNSGITGGGEFPGED